MDLNLHFDFVACCHMTQAPGLDCADPSSVFDTSYLGLSLGAYGPQNSTQGQGLKQSSLNSSAMTTHPSFQQTQTAPHLAWSNLGFFSFAVVQSDMHSEEIYHTSNFWILIFSQTSDKQQALSPDAARDRGRSFQSATWSRG